MKIGEVIGSGITGAVVLTGLHESLRQILPQAPHMEEIGEEIVKKTFEQTGQEAMNSKSLYYTALAGDLITHSILFSLVGSEKKSLLRGLVLGVVAGITAVILPRFFNFKEEASNRTPITAALTIGEYTVGGLAAGGFVSLINKADGEQMKSDLVNALEKTLGNKDVIEKATHLIT